MKYKKQSKIVKGISWKDQIIFGTDKDKIVQKYFTKQFRGGNSGDDVNNSSIFNFQLEIDRAL